MSWVDLPDSLFDPGKPILGSTHMQARDNLAEAFAGGAGAPGLSTKAMEDVTAGDETRWEFGKLVVADTVQQLMHIAQTGTVRCSVTATGAGSLGTTYIRRFRNGSSTLMASGGSLPQTVDVSVEPGDSIEFESSAPSGVRDFTFSVKTSGENLWPSSEYYIFG